MHNVATHLVQPLTDLLLSIADDKLFLGHANSEWTGLAPILEEDIAFSSLAQDEIAHAQALYDVVAELRGTTADELAFGRAPGDYRCASIVEVPDEFDWARAIARRFFCDHFDAVRLTRLANSNVESIAALSRRLHAEENIHVEHADAWMMRLGRGTDDSRARIQDALDGLAPHVAMLWEPVEGEADLETDGAYPRGEGHTLSVWIESLAAVAEPARLSIVIPSPKTEPGGRRGVRTSHFAALFDEMTEVYRMEPGVAW